MHSFLLDVTVLGDTGFRPGSPDVRALASGFGFLLFVTICYNFVVAFVIGL